MDSNTLDELGRAILERAASQRVTAANLESALEASSETIDDRLAQLVDNALLRPLEDDGYELTENGVRVLNATPIGRYDDRIDTPAHVERALESVGLRPDEEAAVRNVFSALRYWGEATSAELIDEAYAAVPAGYDTADRWWDDCVRDRLEGLPDVQPPSDVQPSPNADSPSDIQPPSDAPIPDAWRYDGEAIVDQPDGDGRDVPDPNTQQPSLGSVRHALETADLTDAERRAARVAFTVLFDRRSATIASLTDAVFDDYPAGYDSRDAWADWLAATFDDVPDIERLETDTGAEWQYTPVGDERGLEE